MSDDLSGIVSTGANLIVATAFAGATVKSIDKAFGYKKKKGKLF